MQLHTLRFDAPFGRNVAPYQGYGGGMTPEDADGSVLDARRGLPT